MIKPLTAVNFTKVVRLGFLNISMRVNISAIIKIATPAVSKFLAPEISIKENINPIVVRLAPNPVIFLASPNKNDIPSVVLKKTERK
jgi:hypothetical protein